jgi:flagellar biosynthesis protein FlhB
MADDRDDAQKTELPSQTRLQEAADKGDVTQSPEVAALLMLAAATAFVAIWGSSTAKSMSQMMTGYLAQPHALTLDSESAGGMLEGIGVQILGILALPFAMLVVMGVGAHLIQHAPVFTAEKLKPDISRINPMKGFEKLFGRAALVNFLKGLLKTGLAAAAIWAVVWPAGDQMMAAVTLPVVMLLPFVQELTGRDRARRLWLAVFRAHAPPENDAPGSARRA